jgi:hypothetical protein
MKGWTESNIEEVFGRVQDFGRQPKSQTAKNTEEKCTASLASLLYRCKVSS